VLLSEITKPFEYLAYEYRLAMSLKQLGEAYLKNVIIEVGNTPNYSSNRDLFSCKIAMVLVLYCVLTNSRHHCLDATSITSDGCRPKNGFTESVF
jgi:hypothetical protein